jgi:hypothetical protein
MRLKVLLYFLTLFTAITVSGQIRYSPIKKSVERRKTVTAARTENTSLTLPFWDDFSFTNDNYPVDSLWKDSRGVYVGNGFAIDPPSIGTASFDGVNAEGNRYNGNITTKTDSLKSCPIDLNALTVASNVYISFYYQFAGNGDQPEDTDSLSLEFKNSSGEWITVWPGTTVLNRTGAFVQALVKVDDASFFHDKFQFKFQSYGRPQGVYDLWNLDYVYVNSGRSPSDDNYPDRTIGSPLTSIFNGYTSVPAKHYTSALNSIPSFEVTSVDNPADSKQPYKTYFKAEYDSWSNGVNDQLELPIKLSRLNISIQAPNRNTENLNNLFSLFQIPENQDSIFIKIKTFITANDTVWFIPIDPIADTLEYRNKYIPIDFYNNDTIRSNYILKDYYAYDDGSAEAGAGFSFSGNRLAIKFPILNNVKDTLVAVDMYFPLSQDEPAGRSIDIMVWNVVTKSDLGKIEPGTVLYKETITIQRLPEPNKFVRYKLRVPLALADSFFLGYRQNNEGELNVGFDVNNNSSSNVYFNVGNLWKQKSSNDLFGSFMIRPIFGNTEPDTTTVTAIDNDLTQLKVYPNPNIGTFYVEGNFQSFVIYDIRGSVIQQGNHTGTKRQLISIADRPKGLYVIRLMANKTIKTFKLIKE